MAMTTRAEESVAATAAVQEPPRNRRGRWRPWAFLAPALLLLGGVLGYPVLDGLWTSFNHSLMTQPGADRLNGLDNYRAVLTDPALLSAVWHTVIWGAANLVLQLVLGFALAGLMHQRLAGRAFFRSVVIIPWIVPSVVVALVWRFLLDPTSGPLNQLLLNLGLVDQAPQWLADESTAMPVLILLSTWKWTPLVAVILLAGLQTIPRELHEAAMLDGAGSLQRLRYVVIPGIRTSIALASLLTVGYSVNNFNGIWMFTRGGPAGATETLTTLAYQYAFSQFDFGRAAAVAMILFAFLLVLSSVYFYVVEGRKR